MGLLGAGIYTVQDASRYLGERPNRVRGWVFGYPSRGTPIVVSELRQEDGQIAMTFTNLMEARFVSAFARHGVSVKAMRRMAEEARAFLETPHPFATDMLFKTDGRKIFIEIAEEVGDRRLYDLSSKNWAFHRILAQSFKEDVVYGPSGTALAWHPRRSSAPHVILDPRVAFGQPVLGDSGVPTRALFDAFNAEGETYKSVAHWYEVPVKRVEEAVRFEFELAAAA